MGIGDELRFDLYSVKKNLGTDYAVVRLVSNVTATFAAIIAGTDWEDFQQSIIHTGWLGTCPDWHSNLPIVTMPGGDLLGVEQLEFMLEQVKEIGSAH